MSDREAFKTAVNAVKQRDTKETGAFIARLKSLSAEEFLRLPPKVIDRLSLAQYVDIARTIVPEIEPEKVDPPTPEPEARSFEWTPQRIYGLAISISMTICVALALIAPDAKRLLWPEPLPRSGYAEDWPTCSRLTPQADGCVYYSHQELPWDYVAAALQMEIENLRTSNTHLTDSFIPPPRSDHCLAQPKRAGVLTMKKLELAEYESIPTLPASFAAAKLSGLTGVLLALVLLCLPLSGWHNDQPLAVTAPMLINALLNLQSWWRLDWLPYDIAEQMYFRLGAIGVGMILVAPVGFIVQRSLTLPVDTRQHYSGRRFVFGDAAKASANTELLAKASNSRTAAPELAPDVFWPRAWQVLNLLILGAIGSGKTRILLRLLEGLIVQAKDKKQDFGLLIHDATGEILEGLPVENKDIAVIASTGRSRYGWAMSRDIRTIDDCEAAGAQRAQSTSESGMWRVGAETLDAGVMVECLHAHKHWSAPELYAMSLADPLWLKSQWETHYPPAAGLIEVDHAGEMSKTTISLLITWRINVLRTIRPLAKAWHNLPPPRMFSFADWLHGTGRQPRIVVLPRNGRHPRISAGWIGMAIDAIAGHAGDPALPVSQTRLRILALEEVPTLGLIARWPELLDIGRNKGIANIGIAQDLQQFRSAYKDVSKSILQRFRLKIFCEQTPGPDTKEISDEWIGFRQARDWKLAKTVDGKHQPPDLQKVQIVPEEHLSDRLGVRGGSVRGLLVGLKQIYRLEWPMTVWKKRR